MSDEDGMQESYDAMIAQAERRVAAIDHQLRVAVQNFEVFVLDYTDMVNGLSSQKEKAAKVLYNLHSMKLGRGGEVPSPEAQQETARQERVAEGKPIPEDKNQQELRAEFEKGRRAPGFDKAVVPPDNAIPGEVVTTWAYTAGTDWAGDNEIDEKGHRHVDAILCPAGHPNAPHKEECQVCKFPILATDERRYRVYDMPTGALLSDVPGLSPRAKERKAKADKAKEIVPPNGAGE